jgi:hypothetical protein
MITWNEVCLLEFHVRFCKAKLAVLRCEFVVFHGLCFVDEGVVFVSHLAENLCCNFRTLAPLCARKHQRLSFRYSVSVIHVHKHSILEELMICTLSFGSSNLKVCIGGSYSSKR